MASKSGGKKKRTVAEVGPVEVVDGYEKVMLEDGGFKRRRVGAKKWQRMCEHGRERSKCKECQIDVNVLLAIAASAVAVDGPTDGADGSAGQDPGPSSC